ncbi:MAG: hypothetical protein V2A56_05005, partial [bacterium]
MASPISSQFADYQRNPLLWMTLARSFAENPGSEAPHSLVSELVNLPRPVFLNSRECRKEFWGILAAPFRHLGVGWLNSQSLLEELIPCWKGNPARRSFRLKAMEQVHLEVWKGGLSEKAYRAVCDVHDVVVDRRLNRWAL